MSILPIGWLSAEVFTPLNWTLPFLIAIAVAPSGIEMLNNSGWVEVKVLPLPSDTPVAFAPSPVTSKVPWWLMAIVVFPFEVTIEPL